MFLLFKEWEQKASKLKEEYAVAMKEYEESGNAAAFKNRDSGKEKSDKKKKKDTKKEASVSPSKAMAGGTFKSKEYISDVDSSSGDDEDGSKSKKVKFASVSMYPNCRDSLLCTSYFFSLRKRRMNLKKKAKMIRRRIIRNLR